MQNRIARVEIVDRVINSASAELQVVADPEVWTPDLQLRGRLMGPRCAFATTVEIAYHLRPVADSEKTDSRRLVARVSIPEPSLWDPVSPFLYAGPIELWNGEHRCDSIRVTHGLRLLGHGPAGLTVNGRPVEIRAKSLTHVCTDEEALAMRRGGYSVLVVPASFATAAVWDLADRLGFLVAGRVASADEETRSLLRQLRQHPSCLGWLPCEADLQVPGAIPRTLVELIEAG
jgi:hypothetical protein